MKNTKLYLAIASTIAFILALTLVFSRRRAKQEKEELTKKNSDLENSNVELASAFVNSQAQIQKIASFLESDEEIDLKVRSKILTLIRQYQSIDPKIAAELQSTIQLIESQNHTKAAFNLSKIVENLLKQNYHSDSEFSKFMTDKKSNPKKAVFNDYLDYAQKIGALEKDEHHFAKGLKEIRNQEGHEVGVQKENGFIHTALYAGVALILRLTCHRPSIT